MNITIHRGKQIGGCITEISHGGCKIVIDMGCNLPGSQTREFGRTEVEQIATGADAVFYTHIHGDHLGNFHLVPNNIPQYIGPGAKQVCLAQYNALIKHKPELAVTRNIIHNMRTYEAKCPINVADKNQITVTPFFISHSAFDAYMFLIKAGGLKILHTGDFRTHSYLGKGLYKLLDAYIKEVDILIIEGTMLKRNPTGGFHTERDIQDWLKKRLKETKMRHGNPFYFALCSSTDVERMASLFAACQATDTLFICDWHQKQLLDIFKTHHGKHASLLDFSGDRCRYFKPNNYNYDLMRKHGFIMPIRASHLHLVQDLQTLFPESELIYAMWNGYYKGDATARKPKIVELVRLFDENHFHDVHVSGHAYRETLQEVCRKTKPSTAIIPIHRDADSDFAQLDIPAELKQRVVTETTDIPTKALNISFHEVTASI